MGAKISGWPLARAVSKLGQQGTVSGVALERIMALMLQLGDQGGHLRRALSHFPFPHIAEKVLSAFSPKNEDEPKRIFRGTPVFTIRPSELLISLTICANFAFIWLAKEDNPNPVSINYLEKLAMPHIYAITGAMLADVDFITMGAGIPLQIPAVLEDIAAGVTASYRVPVIGKNISDYTMSFNPEQFFGEKLPPLKKPGFIPIISSNLLANIFMTKLPPGSVQGFVVERPTAGGHNAPPRKTLFNEQGEPVYGPKDLVEYWQIAEHGLPFYIGGSCGTPEQLQWALFVGANGIQAGSIFALSNESDMDPIIKSTIREQGYLKTLKVKTDARVSPTGFPFKLAQLEGTISDPLVYNTRKRVCDQGVLTTLYERPDGSIGYRCGSEPLTDYLRKGGNVEDTIGRACLCNGLIAATGLQAKSSYEAPIVTLGDNTDFLQHLMGNPSDCYSAEMAINYLLGQA
ncbi:MAG: nitronate monooxygenase [Candidatus Falkowbacteria bacterium]